MQNHHKNKMVILTYWKSHFILTSCLLKLYKIDLLYKISVTLQSCWYYYSGKHHGRLMLLTQIIFCKSLLFFFICIYTFLWVTLCVLSLSHSLRLCKPHLARKIHYHSPFTLNAIKIRIILTRNGVFTCDCECACDCGVSACAAGNKMIGSESARCETKRPVTDPGRSCKKSADFDQWRCISTFSRDASIRYSGSVSAPIRSFSADWVSFRRDRSKSDVVRILFCTVVKPHENHINIIKHHKVFVHYISSVLKQFRSLIRGTDEYLSR